MSPEKFAAVLFISVIGLISVVIIIRRLPSRKKRRYYVQRWRELQKLCAKKDTWPLAVVNADSLLDEAMKRKRVSGKTMGERLVAAQKMFTDNDSLWFAHKLRNKIVHDNNTSLKESDVKTALTGFRQAMKDLGVL